MAAKKSASPAYDFVLNELRKNPDVSYADVSSKGEKKGLPKIYPIVYGRAKKALGLVGAAAGKTSKARAAKKPGRKARATQPAAAPAKRRGRPPGSKNRKTSAAALGDFETVIHAMKQNEVERERYRRALEDMRSVLDAALSGK